jgi:hypothetical protein
MNPEGDLRSKVLTKPPVAAGVEPFPFRWNRNGALGFCFDAFSSREPVSTSLENALASFDEGQLSLTNVARYRAAPAQETAASAAWASATVITPATAARLATANNVMRSFRSSES